MRKSFCRGALRALPLLVLAVFMAVQAQAVPLTTKYYSLDLPADWVVVSVHGGREGEDASGRFPDRKGVASEDRLRRRAHVPPFVELITS